MKLWAQSCPHCPPREGARVWLEKDWTGHVSLRSLYENEQDWWLLGLNKYGVLGTFPGIRSDSYGLQLAHGGNILIRDAEPEYIETGEALSLGILGKGAAEVQFKVIDAGPDVAMIAMRDDIEVEILRLTSEGDIVLAENVPEALGLPLSSRGRLVVGEETL
jgi:hypothetical protein